MLGRKISKLIRQYVKAIGLKGTKNYKPEKIIENAFRKGDIYQKKRDLIAMRATIFMNRNFKKGMSDEEKNKLMEEFMKKEDFTNVKWPKYEKNTGNESS